MSQKKSKSKTGSPFLSAQKIGWIPALMLLALRHVFKITGAVSPALAEKLALRVFLTPPRHRLPEWQKPIVASARSFALNVSGKAIQFYEWGPSSAPTVLLVHGWGGRGTQMGAFIDPLLAAGYRVLALDGPAHGASSGKRSDMFEFAAAISAANQIASRLDAIIAHSFGAACTLLAIHQHQVRAARLILIGCPSSAIQVTESFADQLGISRKIVGGMRKQLEHRYGNRWTWEDLSPAGMIKNMTTPILLVHDQKDMEVPYEHAVNLQKANPAVTLLTSEGLGHRRILRSQNIINSSLTFMKESVEL